MVNSSTLSPGLTEYEKKRLENVQRNQAAIAALGIASAKVALQINSPRKSGIKSLKRQRGRDEPIVTRRLRSSRISWSDGEEKKIERSEPPSPVIDTRKPLSWDLVYVTGTSVQNFNESLRCSGNDIPMCEKFDENCGAGTPDKGCIDPSRFSLQEDYVARVVPDRIMSVAFFPTREKILVVAGDKTGHLGFWDVKCISDECGFHLFKPHQSPVSAILFTPSSATKMFSCSYDGTVKQLDVEASMFDLICSTEDDYFTAIGSSHDNANCLYTGGNAGSLTMFDTREGRSTTHEGLHEKRINTIDFNPQNSWLMVTSSTDSTAKVWDVRKLSDGLNIQSIEHLRAIHSAHFSPSGSSIATCSYDNTIAVLRGFKQQIQKSAIHDKPIFMNHPNVNSRWISTFRAIWGWDEEYVFVGNMQRTIDVISTSRMVTCLQLRSPFMKSIPTRLAAHPSICGMLAGCSAGGQVYIWQL